MITREEKLERIEDIRAQFGNIEKRIKRLDRLPLPKKIHTLGARQNRRIIMMERLRCLVIQAESVIAQPIK